MKKIPKKLPPPRAYAPDQGAVHNVNAVNTTRYEDVYYLHHTEAVDAPQAMEQAGVYRLPGKGRVQLEIHWLGKRHLRMRYALDHYQDEFSYQLDPDFQASVPDIQIDQDDEYHYLRSSLLEVAVNKRDGRIAIRDWQDKRPLFEQAEPMLIRSTLLQGLQKLRMNLAIKDQEAFYGLGDKTGVADLRGRRYQNWCTDAFAYGNASDELYRAIPFFYGLRDGKGYGLFLDSSYRTHFDFGHYEDDRLNIWTEGGDFDLHFIYGPELDRVAAIYHQLTGKPELPPLWALGFHQCRWSYYPEERVRELASTFREKQIACDAIYLDIDYMDGYRCFTWNKDYFPDPAGMIADLRKSNFHTIVMIDPGLRVDPDYDVYQSGLEKEVFCRRPSGRLMIGPVWPPECVWPDYTSPAVRAWWGPLYRELYNDQGVSGFWNDMNEPAVFKINRMTFPDDVQHDYDGRGADHKKAHNIYGMQMSRATHEGLKQLQPDKRPFLLCRASAGGGQRYAALWTGDNIANWEHLVIANRQCLRLSISGFSFVGTDIGGFVDQPTGELMVRWLQLGVFHPLMRVHSMGNNTDGAAEAEADSVKASELNNRLDQEPWVFGEPYTSQARAAIDLRYRLLPFLYTAFRTHLHTGIPLLRNLFFYDQQDELCRQFEDQFMVGDGLLVCPVLRRGAKTQSIYLPQGTDWYDYWTGKKCEGGRKHRIRLKADRIPIFLRGGFVLPQVETGMQHTTQLLEVRYVQLDLYYDKAGGIGRLYWDAGEGYAYEGDEYRLAEFRFEADPDQITLHQQLEGSHQPQFQHYRLHCHGLPFSIQSASADGKDLVVQNAVVEVPADFQVLTLR